MPSNPLRGIAANMSRIVSISPNSVMSNGGLYGAAAFGEIERTRPKSEM
jgi:hypothetical protein